MFKAQIELPVVHNGWPMGSMTSMNLMAGGKSCACARPAEPQSKQTDDQIPHRRLRNASSLTGYRCSVSENARCWADMGVVWGRAKLIRTPAMEHSD